MRASQSEIEAAVEALRAGDLVAFPTETVYGLGANASNPAAVRKIFAAKGRPASHPLIVHLDSIRYLHRWVREVPEAAEKLAARFWPGALTLVLPKAASVLNVVTGGQDTVAIRVPVPPHGTAAPDGVWRGTRGAFREPVRTHQSYTCRARAR